MDNCCEDSSGNTKPSVLHAEMNAVIKAAKTGNSVEGSTLYVTLSPCVDCAKYLLQSGIQRVVYLEEYRDKSGIELLKQFIKVEKHVI
jgi:dCMP deaminase